MPKIPVTIEINDRLLADYGVWLEEHLKTCKNCRHRNDKDFTIALSHHIGKIMADAMVDYKMDLFRQEKRAELTKMAERKKHELAERLRAKHTNDGDDDEIEDAIENMFDMMEATIDVRIADKRYFDELHNQYEDESDV